MKKKILLLSIVMVAIVINCFLIVNNDSSNNISLKLLSAKACDDVEYKYTDAGTIDRGCGEIKITTISGTDWLDEPVKFTAIPVPCADCTGTGSYYTSQQVNESLGVSAGVTIKNQLPAGQGLMEVQFSNGTSNVYAPTQVKQGQKCERTDSGNLSCNDVPC